MRQLLPLSCLLCICAAATHAAAQEPAKPQAPAEAGGAKPPAAAEVSATEKTLVPDSAKPPEAPDPAAATPAPLPQTTGGAAVAGAGETPPPAAAAAAAPAPPPPPPPPEPAKNPEDEWQTVWTGYFRAPVMLSTSRHPDPNVGGSNGTQVSWAPNRLVDANYYSFAFTRLNEGPWGEVYLTEKKKHVAATIGFMGYWYAWAGYEQPQASWAPALAFVTLDSDVGEGPVKPHIELKAGVFMQRWGSFGKYDTYLFGRFHQGGEAVQLTVPLNPDLKLRFVHGLGVNLNGRATVNSNPPVQGGTGATLLHYAHAGLNYQKKLDVGLYFNDSWTRDPALFTGAAPIGGGQYADARKAGMTVFGADVNYDAELFGHLWLAASYLKVTNGWALSQTVEIMHSPGGAGIANNYMGWSGDPTANGSTGSGSMFNLGMLYENSLSVVQGRKRGELMPDLTLNLFGMMANASRDLQDPAAGGLKAADKLTQLKWGADLTLQTFPWLGFMARFDQVNLDLDNDGYTYSILTPRVIFSSHFLSNESIWIQYSRYFYGDRFTEGNISPDKHVIKLQANMGW